MTLDGFIKQYQDTNGLKGFAECIKFAIEKDTKQTGFTSFDLNAIAVSFNVDYQEFTKFYYTVKSAVEMGIINGNEQLNLDLED